MSREDDVRKLLAAFRNMKADGTYWNVVVDAIVDAIDARIREAMNPLRWNLAGAEAALVAAGWVAPAPVQPEATACACANIQAADPSRHFKGCAMRVEREPEAVASDEDVCRCTHVSAHPSLYGCPYHECFVCGDPAFEFSDDGGGPHDYRCAGHSRRRTPEATAHKTSETMGVSGASTLAGGGSRVEPALSHPAPVGAEAPVRVTLFASEDGEDVYLRKPSFIPNTNPVAYVRADVYEKAVEALRELHASYVLECEDKCGVCSRCVAIAFLAAHDAASTRK